MQVILKKDVTKIGKTGQLLEVSDGYAIRRCASENNVTVFTALDTVRVLLDVLEETTMTISTIGGR